VTPQALQLGGVHTEGEAEEQADDRDDEEAHDAHEAADDQARVGDACLAETSPGHDVLHDLGDPDRDDRDPEHGPSRSTALRERPDGDRAEHEESPRQHGDQNPDQPDRDGHADQERHAPRLDEPLGRRSAGIGRIPDKHGMPDKTVRVMAGHAVVDGGRPLRATTSEFPRPANAHVASICPYDHAAGQKFRRDPFLAPGLSP
jgi:hypothetical protein